MILSEENYTERVFKFKKEAKGRNWSTSAVALEEIDIVFNPDGSYRERRFPDK
jgi:hypothetical protein